MGKIGDFYNLLSSHLAFLYLCPILFCKLGFIYNEVSWRLIGSRGQFATYQHQNKGTVMNGLGKHKERNIPISVMGLLTEFPLAWLEVPSALGGSQWCSNTVHIIAISSPSSGAAAIVQLWPLPTLSLELLHLELEWTTWSSRPLPTQTVLWFYDP